ncbi:hypothetical protein D3C86_1839800 [compost metagenome]
MISPGNSGREAANPINAQPAWQLPITTGLRLAGWRALTTSMNRAWAAVMSARVCPGFGEWLKAMK